MTQGRFDTALLRLRQGVHLLYPLSSPSVDVISTALRAIASEYGNTVGPEVLSDHLEIMRRRLRGELAWDALVPTQAIHSDPDWHWKHAGTMRNVRRLLPFCVIALEHCLTCTVDVFNPANELELPAHCGEGTLIEVLFGWDAFSSFQLVARGEHFERVAMCVRRALTLEQCWGGDTRFTHDFVAALRSDRIRGTSTYEDFLWPYHVFPAGYQPNYASIHPSFRPYRTRPVQDPPGLEFRVFEDIGHGGSNRLYEELAKATGRRTLWSLIPPEPRVDDSQ